MWDEVRYRLEQALLSRLYPNLFGDPFYRAFLARAGISTSVPELASLSASQRANFEAQARIEAGKAVGFVRGSAGIDEATASFLMLRGPRKLYRAASTHAPEARTGVWWFSEELWRQCLRAGPKDEDKVLWLHQNMAVCYDWSLCDQIVSVEIANAADEVPAIQGLGFSMTRLGSSGIRNSLPPGITHRTVIYGGLKGEKTQIILPFLPAPVRGVRRFATRGLAGPFRGL